MILNYIKLFIYKNKLCKIKILMGDNLYECVGRLYHTKDGRIEVAFNFCDDEILDSIVVDKSKVVSIALANI